MKVVAMIPARLGSKRLPRKNLEQFMGMTLIEWAIHRALESEAFDEIWVNSESAIFQDIAKNAGANFYLRPEELGSDQATSEQFVGDFLLNVDCDYVVQLHSITPLLDVSEISRFVAMVRTGEFDTLLSGVEDNLEHVIDGQPVNFRWSEKSNSQDLTPVIRITWPITAWRRSKFLSTQEKGLCATYSGEIGYFSVSKFAGHAIKYKQDLDLCRLVQISLKESSSESND